MKRYCTTDKVEQHKLQRIICYGDILSPAALIAHFFRALQICRLSPPVTTIDVGPADCGCSVQLFLLLEYIG